MDDERGEYHPKSLRASDAYDPVVVEGTSPLWRTLPYLLHLIRRLFPNPRLIPRLNSHNR